MCINRDFRNGFVEVWEECTYICHITKNWWQYHTTLDISHSSWYMFHRSFSIRPSCSLLKLQTPADKTLSLAALEEYTCLCHKLLWRVRVNVVTDDELFLLWKSIIPSCLLEKQFHFRDYYTPTVTNMPDMCVSFIYISSGKGLYCFVTSFCLHFLTQISPRIFYRYV